MVVLLTETKRNMKNTLSILTFVVSLVLAVFIFSIRCYYTVVFIIGYFMGIDLLKIKNDDKYQLPKKSFQIV
jgi:hypothetical protein